MVWWYWRNCCIQMVICFLQDMRKAQGRQRDFKQLGTIPAIGLKLDWNKFAPFLQEEYFNEKDVAIITKKSRLALALRGLVLCLQRCFEHVLRVMCFGQLGTRYFLLEMRRYRLSRLRFGQGRSIRTCSFHSNQEVWAVQVKSLLCRMHLVYELCHC